MADETPVAPAAIVTESPTPVAASAAPVAATPPIATEAAPSVPAPVVAAPVAEPAPAAVATADPAKPADSAAAAPVTPEPASLLGDAAKPAHEPKPEAAKPEGAKPEGDATPTAEGDAPVIEEARPEEAQLPTYDVFTVPEGVELEDAQVDKFVGTLGGIERDVLAKVPAEHRDAIHAGFQKLGQELLDQYTDEIAQLGTRISQVNAETFSRTMENWKEEFFSDPEIGGNRKDTTLRNAGGVISRFGGSPQQIAEARQVLSHTGAGNSLAVIRLFNNIASFLGEGSPVPATKPEPQAMTRTERRYGKK